MEVRRDGLAADASTSEPLVASDLARYERDRLDRNLTVAEPPFGPEARDRIWGSVDAILSHGPASTHLSGSTTGLALGYVQSGKTTSIICLMAAAADAGYRIIIGLLGGTNLLLGQNATRIEAALGISTRSDYRWVSLSNPNSKHHADELSRWLDRGRTVFIPVLKHAKRIDDLAQVLERVAMDSHLALIVDDEADQASLNTLVKQADESKTYTAISRLKAATPNSLYVQYTATPYAPLLLDPSDHLSPTFVEMLEPGPGYTGGREFFIDEASRVVRPIPVGDEQTPKGIPIVLPGSLLTALASFVAGTAILLRRSIDNAPVSMLVHSTHKNDVQSRYEFLIRRQLSRWERDATESPTSVPSEIQRERERLVANGVSDLPDDGFGHAVASVLKEAQLWLVNSASDIKKIDWHVGPVHILIGGNKLDRGYTVEGLTVSYMNRPASPQIDTLEQRARAFGYRKDLLPFCQFFASARTLESLRGIVYTEYDLRAELSEWLDKGRSIDEWSRYIGLLLPEGTKPTRDSVVSALTQFNSIGEGWHSLRRPSWDVTNVEANAEIVHGIGLTQAPLVDYGRLHHRTLHMSVADVLHLVLTKWRQPDYSPSWRGRDIIRFVERYPTQAKEMPVILLTTPDGRPRRRRWTDEIGFVNLFQGSDLDFGARPDLYPGDQHLFHREQDAQLLELQIHLVERADQAGRGPLYTLAINLGKSVVVRRG